MKVPFLSFCSLLFGVPLTLPAVTLSKVVLNQGAEIKGEVISEKSDRIVLDLGFSVLPIPRDAIASIEQVQSTAAPETFNADLFREESGQGVSDVRELAAQVGEAVVLVKTPTGLGDRKSTRLNSSHSR